MRHKGKTGESDKDCGAFAVSTSPLPPPRNPQSVLPSSKACVFMLLVTEGHREHIASKMRAPLQFQHV